MKNSKIFISYHRADTKYRKKLESILDEEEIEYYAVPENTQFNGQSHQYIKDQIISCMSDCSIVICLIGQETYSRPHVDWEIHAALKGCVGKRKGLIAVMLEVRGDSKNEIDYETFPNRIQDNEEYAVIEQFASLSERLSYAIEVAENNRKNEELNINNSRELMRLRSKRYYDN